MAKQVLFKLISRFRYDDINGYAAQISFYLLLSLFPFLILLAAVLARTQVLDLSQLLVYLRDYDIIPPAALDLVESVFQDLRIPTGTLSFYVIIVLWCASRGIRAIMNGIHMAFRTRESRGIVATFLRSFFYTIAFALLLILFMALVLFGDFLFSWLLKTFRLEILENWLFSLARSLIPILFMYVICLLLYRSVPAKPLRFRDVRLGALLATLVIFIVSKLFSFYTANFGNYSALYGSISGIIVICTWMYFFSFILVLGAEFNAVLYELRTDTSAPPPGK